MRPTPTATASDVRPVRHQARYVRSFARRVRRVASATPGSASGGVGGVAELAELTGNEIHDLLADVDRVVADPLHATEDDEHPQPVLALLDRVAEREHVFGGVPVRTVDQLVEIDERERLVGVARGEC